jgi:hypothetical protein
MLDKKLVGKKVTLHKGLKILNEHPNSHKYAIVERKLNTRTAIYELLLGPLGYYPKTHIIVPKEMHNHFASSKKK